MLVNNNWRFILSEDFEYINPKLGSIKYDNKFISISNSTLKIKKDYAWDGCSPAYKLKLGKLLPQGLWLGIWDGPLNSDCLSVTNRASLVHDVLCQFREEIAISKETSVSIFQEILVANKAPSWMSKLYPFMVKYFGPQDWSEVPVTA